MAHHRPMERPKLNQSRWQPLLIWLKLVKECSAHPTIRNWLRQRMARSFDALMLRHVKGNSMGPAIAAGGGIMIERAQVEVGEAEMILAFGYGKTGTVKRMRCLPRGGFRVELDNQAMRPFKTANDEVHIVGRTVSIMWLQ